MSATKQKTKQILIITPPPPKKKGGGDGGGGGGGGGEATSTSTHCLWLTANFLTFALISTFRFARRLTAVSADTLAASESGLCRRRTAKPVVFVNTTRTHNSGHCIWFQALLQSVVQRLCKFAR